VSISIATVSSVVDARRRTVDEAEHTLQMEGFSIDEDSRSDASEYVAGAIDAGEMVRRARSRYIGG
jgi:hypothetical protein